MESRGPSLRTSRSRCGIKAPDAIFIFTGKNPLFDFDFAFARCPISRSGHGVPKFLYKSWRLKV
jgi:hypothetical protein